MCFQRHYHIVLGAEFAWIIRRARMANRLNAGAAQTQAMPLDRGEMRTARDEAQIDVRLSEARSEKAADRARAIDTNARSAHSISGEPEFFGEPDAL